MNFQRFIPQAPQSDVKCFWVGEYSDIIFNRCLPALPDPFPMLLLHYGAPIIWEMPNGVRAELPRAIFFRPQINPVKIVMSGSFHAIGVNLCAWGTRFLVDEQTDLATPIIPLNSTWQNFAQTLETTSRHYGDQEAVAALEQFISDLHHQARTDITPIRSTIELLQETNGQFRLDELAAHAYLSPSQLDRRFKALVGVTPKNLARLIRFDTIMKAWQSDPSRRIISLIHKFGYVDQPHFIHEFKTFTAHSPREYMRKRDAHFLQVSHP